MEPDFLSQSGEPMTVGQRREWWRKCARDAEAQGATWHRFSYHPQQTDLVLYEGWKTRPADEGELRFQVTKAESK